MRNTTAELAPDEIPIRLDRAIEIAFPYGGMTVSGLRTERAAGRLRTLRMAGKEFVTLKILREWMELCQDQPKAPVSISTHPEANMPSETVKDSIALGALLANAEKLKKSLQNTSSKNTTRREANVVSIKSR